MKSTLRLITSEAGQFWISLALILLLFGYCCFEIVAALDAHLEAAELRRLKPRGPG